jgi:PTS system nitrogen regulatory IIA component
MLVSEILTAYQVSVAGELEGVVRSKEEALRRLAALLASGLGAAGRESASAAEEQLAAEIERVLVERERLQSTGVGSGVAIPHGSMEGIERLTGAVLLCPQWIEFDAIDSAPVSILFAVIGPKRATGEHLKTLARISRLLRDADFRQRLLQSPTGRAAFELIVAEERRGAP